MFDNPKSRGEIFKGLNREKFDAFMSRTERIPRVTFVTARDGFLDNLEKSLLVIPPDHPGRAESVENVKKLRELFAEYDGLPGDGPDDLIPVHWLHLSLLGLRERPGETPPDPQAK